MVGGVFVGSGFLAMVGWLCMLLKPSNQSAFSLHAMSGTRIESPCMLDLRFASRAPGLPGEQLILLSALRCDECGLGRLTQHLGFTE